MIVNLLNISENEKISSSYRRAEMKKSVKNIENVYKKWISICEILNLSLQVSDYWFGLIRDLYQQSWRKYHTLNHIDVFTDLGVEHKNIIKDYLNFMLSVFFHDVIYTPTRGDNEDRSVTYFKDFYHSIKDIPNVKIELIDCEKIDKYIMATKFHFESLIYTDDDLNLLLDFDISGFAEPNFDIYWELTKGIVFEFNFYSEKKFREGRTIFLQKVLKKENIFRTDKFKK